jgi:hypothetical protein
MQSGSHLMVRDLNSEDGTHLSMRDLNREGKCKKGATSGL